MQLSATPVNLKYEYDSNIVFEGGSVYTFDSINYSNSTILASAKDVALNKDQLIVLTDNVKLSDCIKEIQPPQINQYLDSSLIKASNGEYLYVIDSLNTNGSDISTTNNLSLATVFNFYYPTPDTVQIYYSIAQDDGSIINLYLVRATTSFQYISGGNADSSNDYTFYYTISGDSISFISLDTKFFQTSNATKVTYLEGLSASAPNEITIPSTYVYKLLRATNNNSTGSIEKFGQSDLIKYTSNRNQLNITNSSGDVPFNYIITSAYKNLTEYEVDANIALLKNYYSPRHAQTAVLNEPLRTYNKLYTGLNQKDGNKNIYLGYNSSVSKIVFPQDADTYFHYPYGTGTLPVSASELISYGAYADITPWRSDRLFKKVANYKNFTNWGSSSGAYYSNRGNLETGTYFCTWLSAGKDSSITPVWMDRFYDPARVNLTSTTLTNTISALLNSNNNYPNVIWDEPSNARFDPGVLYYYHRIGENDCTTIVNSFSGLAYQIYNWGNNLVNNVTGLTAGDITNFTVANSAFDRTLKAPYYDTGGNTFGTINTNQSDFTNNKGTTLAFYAYSDDWTSLNGEQIVGNYFNGGLGVFNTNEIVTPFFTVASYTPASGGYIYTYNTNLDLINYETYSTFATLSAANFILHGEYDKSYYALDNASSRFLGILDPDDLLTQKIALSSTSQFAYDSALRTIPTSAAIIDAALYIDYSTKTEYIITKTRPFNTIVTYNKFTTDGTLQTTLTSAYNNFVLDLSGNPIFYNSLDSAFNTTSNTKLLSGVASCVNSQNISFALSGTKVVRDFVGIITITSPEHINCDQDDFIWITYNDKFLGKFTSEGNIVWSKQINTDDTIVTFNSNRVINFIAETSASGVQYYGLLLDGKSQHIYKINSDGIVVNKIFVPGLIPNGDATGFDAQRKYIKPNTIVPGLNAKLVVADNTLDSPVAQYITLNYSTSALAPGWHHFAIVNEQINNTNFYVDGVSVANYTSPTSAMFYNVYNYKNNPQINLGATNFKTTTLNEWIERPEEYLFNGNIADVRLYNIALKPSDINHLSKVYLYNQFNSLNWNLPTGTRAYIEEVERFFLHRMPGSKSQLYDIKIKNSQINDPNVRSIVENNIRTAVISNAPTYTTLRNIIWE